MDEETRKFLNSLGVLGLSVYELIVNQAYSAPVKS